MTVEPENNEDEGVRFTANNLIEGKVRLKKGESGTVVLQCDGEDVRTGNLTPDSSSGFRSFRITVPDEILEGGFSLLKVRHVESGRQVGDTLTTGSNPESLPDAPWPIRASSLKARRICIVAPHPDDESLLFGGVILKHRQEGAEVSIVWMTDGEGGGDSEIRKAEAGKAAAFLGVREFSFLGYPDGNVRSCESDAIRRLVKWFESTRPEVVYTSSPDDWHRDHTATARIVSLAAVSSKVPQLIAFGEFYRPIRPNLIVNISPFADAKKKACKIHKSQLKVHDYSKVAMGLNSYRGLLLEGKDHFAEAYYVTQLRAESYPVDDFYRFQHVANRRIEAPLKSLERNQLPVRKLPPEPQGGWPEIDLSVLTYEAEADVSPFLESLLAQYYPTDRIHLRIRDHSPSEDTWITLKAAKDRWGASFATFEMERGKNLGFGAGHNRNFQKGTSGLLLCSNVDLTYEPDTLIEAVSTALEAPDKVAAWEFRQKPFEHPKIYDPVNLAADWCSAACLLLKRPAFESVNGFDEVLFLYGEDVDLSFRLRSAGWILRYCPNAVVIHGANRDPEKNVRPQYRHLHYADFLVRLRFGNHVDRRRGWSSIRRGIEIARDFNIPSKTKWREWTDLAWSALKIAATRRKFRYPSRRSAFRIFNDPEVIQQVSTIKKPVRTWEKKKKTKSSGRFKERTFCFHGLGAGVRLDPLPKGWTPLVSIVVRTDGSREGLLREALRSVSHQTWRAIEVIVVQDGGNSMKSVVEEYEGDFHKLQFLDIPKSGRSATGNAGLVAATGELVGFLDDDDLLLASHLELLISKLSSRPDCPAAASFAIEVPTIITCPATPVYREFGLRNRHRKSFSYPLLWRENLFPIQAVLFRKEMYHRHGGFDETLTALEDWDLWIRYSQSGPFLTVGKSTSIYRVPAEPEEARLRQKTLDAGYKTVISKHLHNRPNLTIKQMRS